ncbi:MAG: hypothetical protein WCM76_00010 [Bacteroidota bacterium]
MKLLLLTALFLALFTVIGSAQKAETPLVFGAFAYVNNGGAYAGWSVQAPYKQFTCKHCHKTITTQLFSKADGSSVELICSDACQANSGGHHEPSNKVADLGGKQNNAGTNQTGAEKPLPQDQRTEKPIENPVIPSDVPETENETTVSDSTGVNIPLPMIDSILIDSYLTVFYTLPSGGNLSRYNLIVEITNPRKSQLLLNETFSLTVSPVLSYCVIIPAEGSFSKIKEGFEITITLTDADGKTLKTVIASLKSGKKGFFALF